MIADPRSLAAQRIVVVAPHPDDESLGCGGLIASLAADGRRFLVVFVTDGGASHLGSPTWPRSRVADQRRREALAALARLGLSAEDAVFLDLPDADMPSADSEAGARVQARLAAIFAAFRPELVLLPWRRDPHCDHRAAWALATAALRATSLAPQTLEYAVWLDELGDGADHPRAGEAERLSFDVSSVLSAKRQAVAAHLTQTTGLIDDAPDAFRLSAATLERLCGPVEHVWRPCA